MDGRGALKDDPAFQALSAFYEKRGKNIVIAEEFAQNADRFKKFR